MMGTISKGHRFLRGRTCGVCGGSEDEHRGRGERCYGFLSSDGLYIHCTREEYAGDAPYYDESQTYAHRATGPCKCNKTHGDEKMSAPAKISPKVTQVRDDELGPIVGEYLYRDETGTVVYRVTRHDQGHGEKTYRPWFWKNAAWVMGNGTVPRRLYHLPDILSASKDAPIYIAEGEKCCDALTRVGLIATTNTGGALKWTVTPKQERHAALRGRHVVILPDNDQKGMQHAQQVAQDLHGIAGSIKIVSLSGIPSKGDVADWLAEAGTREQLEALVATVDQWAPAEEPAPSETDRQTPRRYRLLSRGELRNLPPPTWMIHGMLPEIALSFLVGAPGSYKSFLALDWACCIVTGLPWQNHAVLKKGPVVYLAGEGLGGINKRISAWESCHKVIADDLYTIGEAVELLKPESVGELLAELQMMAAPPIMVIIDTLSRAMVGGDPLSSKEIMMAISAADRIRKTFGCHVLIVHHKNKSDDILGSISIPGGADTIVDIAADGVDLTISCTKQKEFEVFKPIEMQAVDIAVDDNPENNSKVLVLADHESEAAAYHLTRSQRIMLDALMHFGLDGALATEWEKAAVGPGVSSRTYYNGKDKLIAKGFVELQSKGTSRRFQITGMGHQAMTLSDTAPTAIALQLHSMQSHGKDTPPLTGGVSNGPQGSCTPSAGLAPTPMKPLPKGNCMVCKTCNWARRDPDFGGDIICATCHPPTTWKKIS